MRVNFEKFFGKVISILTILTFLFTNIGYAVQNSSLRPSLLFSSQESEGATETHTGEKGGIEPVPTSLQKRYTPEAMAQRINSFIEERRDEMFAVKDKPGELQKIIDKLNARLVLSVVQEVGVAPIYYIEDYHDATLAIESLKKGELVIQMPFAGAGTRMRSSLEALGIKLSSEDLKLANIDIWQIAKEMGLISEIPEHAQRISLAEREMLALEQGILNLKNKYKLTNSDIKLIKDKMKIIVSVSDDIEERIYKLFLSDSRISGEAFFGFNHENIIFVNGGYGPGFEFDKDKRIVPSSDTDNKKVSWNHGFAHVELSWIKGYTLTGEVSPTEGPVTVILDTPVKEYTKNRGGKYRNIHRVNDLILLHPDMAIDVDMFGAFLNLKIQKGNENVNAYFEMMANPTAQKGGLALTVDGEHLLLVEAIGTKHKKIEDKFNELTVEELQKTIGKRGIPYNRLYGFQDIDLPEEEMPLLIKQKDSIISPEIPTGDMTWLSEVKALAGVRRKDILIEQGFVSNEVRDENNNPKLDERGIPIPAYSYEQGGTGHIIHDCKEAKYIKDGLQVVTVLDNSEREVFNSNYYSGEIVDIADRVYRNPAGSML